MFGGIHSNLVGYGLWDIPVKKRSWVLLNWKVKIIKRPKYAETLKIRTWSRAMDKLYALRDFEVFNENGERVIIASSKWVIFNTDKMKLTRIDDDIVKAYTIEEKSVFGDEKIGKLKEPKEYIDSRTFEITNDMIDINKHVHNINYVDFASHILPYEIMQESTNIEIFYKNQIKENDKVKCLYGKEGETSFVTVKSEDEKTLHAILKFS